MDVSSSDPNVITHKVTGANGQAVNLFVVETFAGTDKFVVDKDGNVTCAGAVVFTGDIAGDDIAAKTLAITNTVPASRSLDVRGAAAQSADIVRVRKSDDTPVFVVNLDGEISTAKYNTDEFAGGYDYIIFQKVRGGTTFARSGHTGKIVFSGSASTVIQAVLDALVTDAEGFGTAAGKVLVKRGWYFFAATVHLPESASGYTIEGEFNSHQDVGAEGVLFGATAPMAGTDLIVLDTVSHSNNITFRHITFSSGGYAMTCLLNMAWTTTQSGAMKIDDCWFYGLGMTAGTTLLNLDNQEDSIISQCHFTPAVGVTPFSMHAPGGVVHLRNVNWANNALLSALQVNIVDCVGGGITCDSATNHQHPNFVLRGFWIESACVPGTAILNESGDEITVVAIGGRWNGDTSHAFVGGTYIVNLIADGLRLCSNDASVCELIAAGGGAHRIWHRGLSFLSGPRLSAGFDMEKMGSAVILSGQTAVTFAHGMQGTPIVVVTGRHAEVKDCIVTATATEITITAPGATSGDRTVNYYAEVPY